MSKRRQLPDPDRRKFLQGATLAGAAAVTPVAAAGQGIAPAAVPPAGAKAGVPGPIQVARETSPPDRDPVTQTSSGGDFMVDVLRTLDIDYLAMNCASSFRGLHEAVINYAGNQRPEILTCPHEEIAVAMGHGYAKIEGKPLAMICHGVVGLQHAAMAMYNAWCDRVPVYVMGGNILRPTSAAVRSPNGCIPPWISPRACAIIPSGTTSRPRCSISPNSAVRAYKIATTPPMGPVLISLDAELQENPIPEGDKLHIPKLSKVIPPQADDGALAEVGKAAGRCASAAHRGRSHGAHAGRHRRGSSNSPNCCNARCSIAWAA